MPAGVTWGQYIKFLSCAMLSMMAGSQLVHMYYKPLKDLDVYIEREMKNTAVGSASTTIDAAGITKPHTTAAS